MKVLNQRKACRAIGLAEAGDAAITTEDFFVPSDTTGIDLHLRRKRLADVERFPGERTLLLMHGATFSSGSLFDAPAGGASFMDQLAVAGFDVYVVDVRGYGASTWPPEMEGAVDPSTQPVRIETAIRDLGKAVDYILEYRRLDQLNLVAMSWGGSVAGAYTAKNNGKIKRLALIAPLWLRDTPGRIDQGGNLPAYREVDLWKYEESRRSAAPKDQREALIHRDGLRSGQKTLWRSDQREPLQILFWRLRARYRIFANIGPRAGRFMIPEKSAYPCCSFMRNGTWMSPLTRREISSAG
jgi:pimeloyl-ACP methyl ester carboxylesterase